MDLPFQVLMQCCSLQHQTTSVTSHIHNWVLFLLWLHPFILSGVTSPLISSSILGPYRPGEFIFQYLIFLPFHTVHGVLKARILKWFATPFSSGPRSVRPWPVCLRWPHTAWLSFIELDKVSCWDFSLALGRGVSPHSRFSAYCLSWVSLTLDVGYLYTGISGWLAPWCKQCIASLKCQCEAVSIICHNWERMTWREHLTSHHFGGYRASRVGPLGRCGARSGQPPASRVVGIRKVSISCCSWLWAD